MLHSNPRITIVILLSALVAAPSQAFGEPSKDGGDVSHADAGSAAQPDARSVITADLRAFVSDAEQVSKLEKDLDAEVQTCAKKVAPKVNATVAHVREQLLQQIAHNLEDKRALKGGSGESFPLSAAEIRRQVFGYEAFKLEAFLSSGVFPKRYFGYLDLKWDTAAYEVTLRDTVHRAVALANAQLATAKSPTRITDAEVVVTFLAEGGAQLLLDHQGELDDIHPVYGIGLDDIAVGFGLFPELITRFDQTFDTHLSQIIGHADDGSAYLVRNFRFKEAVLGTTVMWVYEKERCAKELVQAKRPALASLKADEQFVVSSLVYNSGKSFDAERLEQIRSFTTGDYLFGVSQASKRSHRELPVLPASRAWTELSEAGTYPEQPTSWSAVYHVLQRYGAYVALIRFTDLFDEQGMFRPTPAPALPSASTPAPVVAPPR